MNRGFFDNCHVGHFKLLITFAMILDDGHLLHWENKDVKELGLGTQCVLLNILLIDGALQELRKTESGRAF